MPTTTAARSTRPTTPSPATPPPPPGPRVVGPTRVAVVGCGYIADYHLQILTALDEVDVVAVLDTDVERARVAAERYGVEHATDSVEELAGLAIRVAHVAVPPPLHLPVARDLLEHGIGVFCEKPLALSTEDVTTLTALASERGLPLGVNHNAAFAPAFRSVLERVRSGAIGRVEHVQITLAVPLRQLDAGDFAHWMFRAPRNIVFEQAPHPFAQVHELVGRVEECTTTLLATRELMPGQVFHSRWLVAARAERGTVEAYFDFGATLPKSTLTVLASDGTAEADLGHDLTAGETKTQWLDFWNSFLAGWRRGSELRRSARAGLVRYLRQTLGLGPRQDAFYAGMRDSMRAFHVALRNGTPPPAGGAEADSVLAWCEAVTEGIAGEGAAESLPDAGPIRSGEVVVFGGTGFIGRPTVTRLLERGRPVTCVVRRAHALPPAFLEAARAGRLRLVRGSLEDTERMAAIVDGAHTVVQLATGGGASWDAIERSMVGGSKRLAQAALRAGVERFVYVSSTAALYLGADAGPIVTDATPPDPEPWQRSLYARGKIAAEKALRELEREGLPLVVVRPGVVLGRGTPLQHSGLGLWVRDNHCVGWGDGTNALPVVWNEDVAEAIARTVESTVPLAGRSLNLAADVGLTARDLVDELRRATGRALVFHPRSLLVSQIGEIGKWIVKQVGGRRDAPFPSWRDLKSRALVPKLSCETARDVLGWRPVEDRERFLEHCVEPYAER